LPGVLGGEVDGTDRAVEEDDLAGKREKKEDGKESDQRAGKEGRLKRKRLRGLKESGRK